MGSGGPVQEKLGATSTFSVRLNHASLVDLNINLKSTGTAVSGKNYVLRVEGLFGTPGGRESLQPALAKLDLDRVVLVRAIPGKAVEGDRVIGISVRDARGDVSRHVVTRVEHAAPALNGQDLQ